MKVSASVKKRCPKVQNYQAKKALMRVICENPRHKQRQG